MIYALIFIVLATGQNVSGVYRVATYKTKAECEASQADLDTRLKALNDHGYASVCVETTK